jgi:hypothetical protein
VEVTGTFQCSNAPFGSINSIHNRISNQAQLVTRFCVFVACTPRL